MACYFTFGSVFYILTSPQCPIHLPYRLNDITMDAIPESILLKIFSHLDVSYLCLSIRMTCTRWRRLSFDPQLWRIMIVPEQFNDQRLDKLLRPIHMAVEELDCGACDCLTEEGFRILLELEFPRLSRLVLPVISRLSSAFLAQLPKTCPRIQELANIGPNTCGTCDPYHCQSQFPQLRVFHDKTTAAFIRKRPRQPMPRAQQQRTGPHRTRDQPGNTPRRVDKWREHLARMAATSDRVREYVCHPGMDLVTDDGLEFVSRTFPCVVSVQLLACPITDDGIRRLLCHNVALNGLDKIVLHELPKLTDASLIGLADSCPNLGHFTLSKCPQVTEKGLCQLSEKCRKLRELNINWQRWESASVDPQVKVNAVQITDALLSRLAENNRCLEKLRLFYTEKITDLGLSGLLKSLDIQELILFECASVTDESIFALAGCSLLENLVLVNNNFVTPHALVELLVNNMALCSLVFFSEGHGSVNACGTEPQRSNHTSQHSLGTGTSSSSTFGNSNLKKMVLNGVNSRFVRHLIRFCQDLEVLDLWSSCLVDVAALNRLVINFRRLAVLDLGGITSADDVILANIRLYSMHLQRLALGGTVQNMTTGAISDVIKACVSLHTISMDIAGASLNQEELIEVTKRYHGGHCTIKEDPEFIADPFGKMKSHKNFWALYFVPIKYLVSINACN